MAALVILALTWSVGSSLSIYPHSLSYFNELAAILPTLYDDEYPKPVGCVKRTDESVGCVERTNENNEWCVSRTLHAWASAGPRHLLDSNIDWGQDLFFLKDWFDAHPEAKLDGLAYWGSYPATLASIPETAMPPVGLTEARDRNNEILRCAQNDRTRVQSSGGRGQDGIETVPGTEGDSPIFARTKIGTVPGNEFGPKPGWYALSVNYIYGRDRQYRYFLNYEPVAMAGYSIYIYHITLDEANRVRRDMGMGEIKEEGGRMRDEGGRTE